MVQSLEIFADAASIVTNREKPRTAVNHGVKVEPSFDTDDAAALYSNYGLPVLMLAEHRNIVTSSLSYPWRQVRLRSCNCVAESHV